MKKPTFFRTFQPPAPSHHLPSKKTSGKQLPRPKNGTATTINACPSSQFPLRKPRVGQRVGIQPAPFLRFPRPRTPC
jgi:hypothetical protein